MKYVMMVLLLTVIGSAVRAQPGFPDSARAAVFRVVQPNGGQGTAILFEWGREGFLITNRHVLVDAAIDRPFDSLFVYLNRVTFQNEVVSGPHKVILFPVFDGERYYSLPADTSIDLAYIGWTTFNSNVTLEDSVVFANKTLLQTSRSQLDSIIHCGDVITAVGYPGKKETLLDSVTFPEYRWGDFKGWHEDIAVADIPVRRGNSGSPVFIRCEGEYHLLGIHFGRRDSDGFAGIIPPYVIVDAFSDEFLFLDSLEQLQR